MLVLLVCAGGRRRLKEQTDWPPPALSPYAVNTATLTSFSQRLFSQPLDISPPGDTISETHSRARTAAYPVGLSSRAWSCWALSIRLTSPGISLVNFELATTC